MQAQCMSFPHLCSLRLGGRGIHFLIQRIAWWVLGDLLQQAAHWGHGVLTPGSYTVPGKWAARDLGMLYHNHQQLERGRGTRPGLPSFNSVSSGSSYNSPLNKSGMTSYSARGVDTWGCNVQKGQMASAQLLRSS